MVLVLTFHSIGLENSNWSKSYLASPVSHFQEFCKYITEEGYRTISLDEWYEMQDGPTDRKGKYLALTFDDGYLDNWVYVYPIIKKYGIKITIFVNPEFVDPTDCLRPNLDEVWNNKKTSRELQTIGFLNWTEMFVMEQSGLVDIQSHSMTHDTYFKSHKIIDYFDGSSRYDWLSWWGHKERKPYYMRENTLMNIKKGFPIFEYDRSLAVRKFLPSDSFIEYCIETYSSIKNKHEVRDTGVRERILKTIQRYAAEVSSVGRYETDEEMEQRYRYELEESKRIIEEKLNKRVSYLCWPGGRYNERSLFLSKEAGYRASTATKKSEGRQLFSENTYKRITRIGMGSTVRSSRNIFGRRNHKGLVYCFREHAGNNLERLFYQAKRRTLQLIG